MRNAIIGTAGHIDHGKTTLVKALTGIDADRLEEEKRRGITIDIGFAHMQVDGWRLGFVDVPGHEKCVKNMLAGIGGIDIALLVVASDESIMPQTVEHFQICRLLQIRAGVIALTKKANVDEELLELVSEEVRDLVRGSFLQEAPVVAVDSLTGEGIESLKTEIVRCVEATKARSRSSETCFRLPIDRVFTIRGFGTVVTGTPTSGETQVEKVLQAYPGDARCKVRGLEIFNQKTTDAKAGQRTALNVSGVERQSLQRGMVLAPPGVFDPSHMFDVEVELLPDAPSPLKQRAPVRFHHGSAELLGRLHLLDRQVLERGEVGLAQIRLDTPTLGCLFDRFILRRYSPMTTIGGGVILDAQPTKHRRRDLDRLVPEISSLAGRLREQGRASLGHFVAYYVRMSGIDGLDLDRLVSRTGVLSSELERTLSHSPGIVLVPVDPPLAVAESALNKLWQTILEFLAAFHEKQPLSSGASREELKRRFLARGSNAYFQFVLERLAKEGAVRLASGKVSLASNEVRLSADQQDLSRRLLEQIETESWNPPGLAQLTELLGSPAKNIQEIFYFFLENGTIVKVSEDIVLTARRVEQLVLKTRTSFPAGVAFSVADFKDLLGVSRKFAIPYLEYLDRNGVTHRVGDRRMIKQ